MGDKGDGLRDEIAPMIYGLDVDGARKRAETMVFVKDTSSDPLGGRVLTQPHKAGAIDFAESDLMKGDVADASDLAGKVMADPAGDHGRAQYVLARIDLMQGQPDKAMEGFAATLKLSQDPRTVAWSHIYLGTALRQHEPTGSVQGGIRVPSGAGVARCASGHEARGRKRGKAAVCVAATRGSAAAKDG